MKGMHKDLGLRLCFHNECLPHERMQEVFNNCRVNLGTSDELIKDAIYHMSETYFTKLDTDYTFPHDFMFEAIAFHYGRRRQNQILKYLSSSYIAQLLNTSCMRSWGKHSIDNLLSLTRHKTRTAYLIGFVCCSFSSSLIKYLKGLMKNFTPNCWYFSSPENTLHRNGNIWLITKYGERDHQQVFVLDDVLGIFAVEMNSYNNIITHKDMIFTTIGQTSKLLFTCRKSMYKSYNL
jgi:hypothetical protein